MKAILSPYSRTPEGVRLMTQAEAVLRQLRNPALTEQEIETNLWEVADFYPNADEARPGPIRYSIRERILCARLLAQLGVGRKDGRFEALWTGTIRAPGAALKPVAARSPAPPAIPMTPAEAVDDGEGIDPADLEKPPVLAVNSYAGSLLIGAAEGGFPVVGSYEDAGFGMDVQKANFKNVDFRETRSRWPEMENRMDELLIAHPPCAAFSSMTRGMGEELHGADAAKFQATIDVIGYGTDSLAAAVMVESVQGALEGAADIHEHLADRQGGFYNLYRVLQNGVTFGTPQWRPRFWSVFIRRDALADPDEVFYLRHQPETKLVRDIVLASGTVVNEGKRNLQSQRRRLREKGLDDRELLDECRYGHGTLAAIIARKLKADGKPVPPQADIIRTYCLRGPLVVNTLRVLDPNDFAPVLLATSWWAVPDKGTTRELFQQEYMRVMGFPEHYRFREDEAFLRAWLGTASPVSKEFRKWLSKGVIPGVATWILNQVAANLAGHKGCGPGRFYACPPGGVVDLQPGSRKALLAQLNQRDAA